MKYLQNNLNLLLEYENLSLSSLLEKISENLDLQYYVDDSVHTLCNEHFLCDLKDNIKITYVNETLNNKIGYIELYLNYFYSIKKFKKFYQLLKIFVNFLKTKSGFKNKSSLKTDGQICKCISS